MKTVIVPRYANVHSHLREFTEIPDLIRLAYLGGASSILPMPNTTAPLTTAERVSEYIKFAKSVVFRGSETLTFIPTAMLTEETTVEEVAECAKNGIWDFKVYPRNRTTKSQNGVVNYYRIVELVRMADYLVHHIQGRHIRVHFHPEHPSMLFPNRDAEYLFLPVLYEAVENTRASIISEHGTDSRCIPHWKKLAESGRFYVTLTAHHLATNEDESFGDVRCVCKPPIKLDLDREALLELVRSDQNWVMAGPDDAPHPVEKKFVDEGCAACGAYTAPFCLQLYAHGLDNLILSGQEKVFQNFIFHNAQALYGLTEAEPVRLVRKPYKIPANYTIGSWTVQPFWAGRTIAYSLGD